ncbi:MAG: hypothetical protein R2737_10355 [Candidatus Nanopelagicales bacterium]
MARKYDIARSRLAVIAAFDRAGPGAQLTRRQIAVAAGIPSDASALADLLAELRNVSDPQGRRLTYCLSVDPDSASGLYAYTGCPVLLRHASVRQMGATRTSARNIGLTLKRVDPALVGLAHRAGDELAAMIALATESPVIGHPGCDDCREHTFGNGDAA